MSRSPRTWGAAVPARLAALLFFCCFAVSAAASPGWLLVFSNDDGKLEATSVVATSQFVRGHDFGDAEWNVRVVDAAGRSLYSAPVAVPPHAADGGHVDARARRLSVRVPALALARRIEIVDAAGAVVWQRDVDTGFRAAAQEAAKRTAETVAKALRSTDATAASGAIARSIEYARADRKRAQLAAIDAYRRTPDEAHRERMERLLDPASAQLPEPATIAATRAAPHGKAVPGPIVVGSNIAYRGRVVGEDGSPIGTPFRVFVETGVAGMSLYIDVDAKGNYNFDLSPMKTVHLRAEPPAPYPNQVASAPADAAGSVGEIRLKRGWAIAGSLHAVDGSRALGQFSVQAITTHGGIEHAVQSENGRYAVAVSKENADDVSILVDDVAIPSRYLQQRVPVGRVAADRTVDVALETGIDVAVRPASDGPMPSIDWQVGCFNGPDYVGYQGHGATPGTLTVKAGRPYRCTFTPAAPYRTLNYGGLVFESRQAWFPALLGGNEITLNLTGDPAPNNGEMIEVYVDAMHQTFTSAMAGWKFIAPTGTVVANWRGNDSMLPAAVGPRRVERNETLDLVLRRGASVTGFVSTRGSGGAATARTAFVHAYRPDGSLAQSAEAGSLGDYTLRLPFGTYDIEARPFVERARDYLAVDPIRRTGVTVQQDAVVDFDVPVPAHIVSLTVRWRGCEALYSVEATLRKSGRVVGRPLLTGFASSTCTDGVRNVTYVKPLADGEYEIGVHVPGSDPSEWRAVDTRGRDASVAFDLAPERLWNARLVDAQRRPLPEEVVQTFDGAGRNRAVAVTDADGRFTAPVHTGWHARFFAPLTSKETGKVVVFDAGFSRPSEVMLEPLPLAAGTGTGVRKVLASTIDSPIRVLVLGDGYVAERETFTDTNGNGVWDGVVWYDLNRDGVYRADDDMLATFGNAVEPDDGPTPTAANEPFVDTNGDGVPNIDDAAVFAMNVETHLRGLFGADYWAQRRGDFEVSSAFLASPQAGVSIISPGGTVLVQRQTLFDARYLQERSLLSIDFGKAIAAAEQLVPGYDLLLVTMNQPIVVGRAGTTVGPLPNTVMGNGGLAYNDPGRTPLSHELGHALGRLADEYIELSGYPAEAEAPELNVTGRSARADIEWADLIAADRTLPDDFPTEGVGLFPGAKYYTGGAYRPSWNSTMRVGTAFDAVGRRTLDARMASILREDAPVGVVPGNWYDRRRSGHGIDLQPYSRDGVAGDLYFVVFYTYDETGKPEWYQALGRLTSGSTFVPIADANGKTLTRVRGGGGSQGTPDASTSGDFMIDFKNTQACRTSDRADAAALAAMYWNVGGKSAIWCIEPAVRRSMHATPKLSGHWYAPSDSGWGMEVTAIDDGSGGPTVVAFLYYVDSAGRPRWASASSPDYVAGQPLTAYEADNGYCRDCAAPAVRTQAPIGRITLSLVEPLRDNPAGGRNRVDIEITPPGGVATFRKTDVPVSLLSEPLQ